MASAWIRRRTANVDVAGSITLLAVSIVAASIWGRAAARRRHARSRQSVHT
jgi:hypothetical protein